MNTLCYCQSQLTQYQNPRDNRICINCVNPISDDDQYLYPCFNQQCIYQSISTQPYIICSECYTNTDVDEKTESSSSSSSSNGFIFNKFVSSLNKISLVLIVFCFNPFLQTISFRNKNKHRKQNQKNQSSQSKKKIFN